MRLMRYPPKIAKIAFRLFFNVVFCPFFAVLVGVYSYNINSNNNSFNKKNKGINEEELRAGGHEVKNMARRKQLPVCV